MDLIVLLGSEWKSHFHPSNDENTFSPLTVDSEQMTSRSHRDNTTDIKSLARPIQPPPDIPLPFIKSHFNRDPPLTDSDAQDKGQPHQEHLHLGEPDLPAAPQPSTGLPMDENGSGSLLIPVTSFLSDQPSTRGKTDGAKKTPQYRCL